MTVIGIVPVIPTQLTSNMTAKELLFIMVTVLVIALFFFIIPSQLAKMWRKREGIAHKLNVNLRDITNLVKKGRVRGLVCKIQGKYEFLPAEAISFEYTDEYPYTYVRTGDNRIPAKDCEVIYDILNSHQLHSKEDNQGLLIKIVLIVITAMTLIAPIGIYLFCSSCSLRFLFALVITVVASVFAYFILLYAFVGSAIIERSQEIGEDKKRKLFTADGILYTGVYYPKNTLTILDGTLNFVKLPNGRIVPLKNCEIVFKVNG